MPKIAIVQQPPVLLDRSATLQRAIHFTEQCAEVGAELIIFPEAFIPGYPVWIWRLRPGGDMGLTEMVHAELFKNSVSLEEGDLVPLYDTARKKSVTLVCGINERGDESSRTTLYNTVVIIGPDGTLLNRHRKLMPTNAERMVWGFGDATGLKVVDTPCGRVGALICWENYMPQTRLSLYAQGIEIYAAPTFDEGDTWVASMQHIAREGRCWVLGGGFALNTSDIPESFPEKKKVFPDTNEWVNSGDSVIVAPGGSVVAGPLRNEYGVLYADLDLGKIVTARRALDVAGHYARPDIFRLHVNTQPMEPVVFGTNCA